MEHLSPETLARLVDEAPDAEERAHLERCAECADTVHTQEARQGECDGEATDEDGQVDERFVPGAQAHGGP